MPSNPLFPEFSHVETALRARRCFAEPTHVIPRGAACVVVQESGKERTYCHDCAARIPPKEGRKDSSFQDRRVMAARLRLMRLAGSLTLAELLKATLEEAQTLSGSRMGFYHFVDPDQVTLSLQVWSSTTASTMCRAEGAGLHYPVDRAGVWVDCLRERLPVIHNDYASLPHRKGLPDGHVPVIRELVVPVMRNDRFVAVLGVGNKQTDYDARDVEAVASLADLAWDAVEGKRKDEALRLSHARLREAQEISRMGRWELDLATNELVWMDAVFTLLGLDPGTFRPSYPAFMEVIHPDDRAQVAETFRESVQNRKPYDIEHRVTLPDGRVRWVNEIGRTEYSDTGEPLRCVGTVQDITERKATRDLLSVQADTLAILAAPGHLLETAAKIVESLKKATGFDAVGLRLREGDDYPFAAAVGYSDDFLRTENSLAVRYPDGGLCRNEDGSVSLECICGTVLGGKLDLTNPLFTPGGSAWTNDARPLLAVPPELDFRVHPRNRCIHVGFLSLALIPLRAGPEILGLLHLADRTPDRFTAESVRFFEGIGASIGMAIQRRKAEEAVTFKNAEIERFTAIVSHDLRSPLVTIGTFLGHLEEDLGQNKTDRIDADLGFIRTATDKMGRLLEDLQKVALVGRNMNAPTRVTVAELVQEALKTAAGAIADRGVAVEVQPTPLALFGDRKLLEVVWRNLVENAVKYMGDQPFPRLELGVQTQGTEPVFFVRDNGMGIDPRSLARIFEMFVKLDATSAGTGMGLALVKSVVELYEGRIWVESEGPGRGACFCFTLPLALKGPPS